MVNQARFIPPLCYQFNVTTKTISSSAAISRVVTVKNGVALEGFDLSLSDYMQEINSSCYLNCPASGAVCSITYYSAGFPFRILIDDNQSIVGEEMNVVITNFAELECDDIPDLPASTEAPSDAVSDPPSDETSDTPSDAPTMVGPPNEAPVDSPVSLPVDMPVEGDSPVGETPSTPTGDVSGIDGGESSSALKL